MRRVATFVHHRLEQAPRWLIRLYFLSVSFVSRTLLPHGLQQRVHNSLCGFGHSWPALDFAPKTVSFGKATSMRLVPHLGELDDYALFGPSIDYDHALFEWLEERVRDYDLIIEIGANVSIYSVFFRCRSPAPARGAASASRGLRTGA